MCHCVYPGLWESRDVLEPFSAIVSDFAMERRPDALGSGAPESRMRFKVETVTRTERPSEGKSKISSLTWLHYWSGFPVGPSQRCANPQSANAAIAWFLPHLGQ